MPFLGLGLHILVAVFFAIHAVRSGQQMYWLLILFSFPLLGSIVYFVAIYLPGSGLQRGARKAVVAAARSLDPSRELREAQDAFDYTPTAQNQMRLALAHLEAGDAAEAARNYEACLKGPFAADLEIKFCAARAFVECGRDGDAIRHLQEIRAVDAGFRAEQVGLLIARAYAGAEQHDDARHAFDQVVHAFGTFEAKAEYAIWALNTGNTAVSDKLLADLSETTTRWTKHTRELNKPYLSRLESAKANARGAQ